MAILIVSIFSNHNNIRETSNYSRNSKVKPNTNYISIPHDKKNTTQSRTMPPKYHDATRVYTYYTYINMPQRHQYTTQISSQVYTQIKLSLGSQTIYKVIT